MTPAFEQRLWNILHDVNRSLLEEGPILWLLLFTQMAHRIRFIMYVPLVLT